MYKRNILKIHSFVLYLLISLVNWIFFFQELLRNIIIMYSVVDFFNFLVRVEERGGGEKREWGSSNQIIGP